MSSLQALAWGAVGGAVYPSLRLFQTIVQVARSEVEFAISLSRVVGFIIIVIAQCAMAGLAAMLVVGGSREDRPLVAIFVGLAWAALIPALATRPLAGAHDDDLPIEFGTPVLQQSGEPRRTSRSPATSLEDLKRDVKLFTSGRVTAAATVVMAVVALLAYITR
jgi:hypothetical protein